MLLADTLLSARILIVDDQDVNIRLLELVLRREGFTNIRSVSDSYEVIPTFASYHPDIILLDLLMPGIDGFAIMELLRRRISEGEYLPILVLTADSTAETRRRALALGAKDFLTKPFDQIEIMLRIWNLLETRFLYRQIQRQNQQLGVQVKKGLRDLDEAQMEVISRLAQAVEYRDENTGQHTLRVGRISAMIARVLGLDDEQVELIRLAAPLHDVGKIAIPDQILLKPGKLTHEEMEQMKAHTSIGARLLAGSRLSLLQVAHEIALYHHERWDGAGYPHGIKGTAIPISARIVAVADAFDALTHERPYKNAWSINRAVEELRSHQGTRYDPQVLDALVQVLEQDGLLSRAYAVSQ
ncbi:HD domain-containing phosphohydrolase [Candidatus Oscillochloris fontis]|uniref:HD domain-containing phosphohydrolase n=1 Tax=Candidatus Oscillochloris fontis TaxID=2496868 RepID=UPI00101D15D2|nr:HD domain-containing phosphohydrolase [Candidatus Oscillochloris fontis]